MLAKSFIFLSYIMIKYHKIPSLYAVQWLPKLYEMINKTSFILQLQ